MQHVIRAMFKRTQPDTLEPRQRTRQIVVNNRINEAKLLVIGQEIYHSGGRKIETESTFRHRRSRVPIEFLFIVVRVVVATFSPFCVVVALADLRFQFLEAARRVQFSG